MGCLRWLDCFGFFITNASTKCPKIPPEYLKPQGLYPSSERIDLKKLRKLIIDGRLVACYPGLEEGNPASCDEAEECPICMLIYPVLNTSRCCAKRVCTECFLQVQATASRDAPPNCPFCKTPSYTATFCGGRSEASRNEEKLAEQNVLEARIREREEEVLRDQERVLARSLLPAQPPAVAVAAAAAAATVPVIRNPARNRSNSTAVAAHHPHGGGHRRRTSSNVGSRGDSPVAGSRQVPHGSPSRHATLDSRGAAGSPVLGTQTAQTEGGAGSEFANMAAMQPSASRRRYRLADYIPTGVVDIAVSVEDINAYMLEQAMYDSIAAAAAADASPADDDSLTTAPSTARDSPQARSSPATAAPRTHHSRLSSRAAAMQDTSAVLAALLPLALQAAGMPQPTQPTTTLNTPAAVTLHQASGDSSTPSIASAATSNYNSSPLCVLRSTASVTSLPQTELAAPSSEGSETPLRSKRCSGVDTPSRLASPAAPPTPAVTEVLQPHPDCSSSDGFFTLLTLPASNLPLPLSLSPVDQPPSVTSATQSHLSQPVPGLHERATEQDLSAAFCQTVSLPESGSNQGLPETGDTLASSSGSTAMLSPSTVGTSSSGGGAIAASQSQLHRLPPPPPADVLLFGSASSSSSPGTATAVLTLPYSPLEQHLFSDPSYCETTSPAQQSGALSDPKGERGLEEDKQAAANLEQHSLRTIGARLALQGTPSLQDRSPYIGMVMQVLTSVYHPGSFAAAAAVAAAAGGQAGSSSSSSIPQRKVIRHREDESSRDPPPATALLQNPDGSMSIITCPILIVANAAAAKAALVHACTATADMPEHELTAAAATAAYSDASSQPYTLGAGVSATAAYCDADVCSYSLSGAVATTHVDHQIQEVEESAATAGYADYSLSNVETGEGSGYPLTEQDVQSTGGGDAWDAMSAEMRKIDQNLVAAMAASDAQMAALFAAQDAATSSNSWAYSDGGQQPHSNDEALMRRLAEGDERLLAGFLGSQ